MAVTALRIQSRQPFAQGIAFGTVGPYEQLDGSVYFAVDPHHPANSLITDLKLAPQDASGRVHFSADYRLLRPVETQRGNHRILFDILNRGRGPVLRNLNSAPEVTPDQPLDPGNGFVMRQGYTVAWCGWQHDAPDVPGIMRLHAPEATTPEGPISGKMVVTLQPNAPAPVQFLANRMHRSYPTHNLEDGDAVLTEQDHEDAPERVIPRHQWSFARLEDGRVVPDASHVYMASGFLPGKVYQVIYTTTGAPIVGLGLLATRDMGAFLRYGTAAAGNPCAADVEYVYSFGVSQSGRFLRDFLYLGLNQDEHDRTVFDGLMPHVAGGKRGEFNQRFAQPSSQASRSPNSLFPFSDTQQIDPETGRTDGLQARLAAGGTLPKVMYTYASSEYWGGHGALVHIDVTGSRDLEVPESVRIYHFGGAQHPVGTFPLRHSDPTNGCHGQQPFNWTDYRPLLRAALVQLDRWVSSAETPPPSRYPRLDDGTAVPAETLVDTFRALPGVNFPAPLRRFTRLDFGPDAGVATKVPPVVGAPYPCLVPAVDQDGNEVCGIRLPFQTVPLATYTGWNLRHPDIGGAGQILASGGASGGTLLGSTIPFPATREERQASADPRRSIEERYASMEDYQERVRQATESLIQAGYLLAEDLEEVVAQAVQHYEVLHRRIKDTQAAND
ncbi:MAG: alpha/beta hydrolase domain-containing protein [Candidatus Tectomicrobia bacterium]